MLTKSLRRATSWAPIAGVINGIRVIRDYLLTEIRHPERSPAAAVTPKRLTASKTPAVKPTIHPKLLSY
jgi:hypothetical protein